MHRTGLRHVLALCLLFVSPAYSQSPDILAQRILGNHGVQQAREMLDRDSDAIRADAIRFAETRTPEELTAACVDAFKRNGLSDVTRDEAGNVLGLRKGSSDVRGIAIAVRLPPGAWPGQHITTQGSRLTGAGIADSYTLALFLDSIHALNAARIETSGNILFIVTAAGDPVRRRQFLQTLFENSNYKGRIAAFVDLEPLAANAIITESPATRLYRAHLSDALRAADSMAMELRRIPQVQSLTSAQASPETRIDFEIQAETAADFDQVDSSIRRVLEEAVRRSPDLQVRLETVAEFPAARTNVSLTIVQLATAVMKELHLEPSYESKSADVGAAMNLGLPSIGIGSVETDGKPYGYEEGIDVKQDSPSLRGTIILSVVASFVGVR